MARLLIGAVMAINVLCAVAFFVEPEHYAPAYELIGVPGEAAIQGFGVLFLMWNVPYLVALLHPQRHRTSLMEAVVMQSIGLLGETLILRGLPAAYPTLHLSLRRFILFDAAGLVALIVAAWITLRHHSGETSA